MDFNCQRCGQCCADPSLIITLTHHDLLNLEFFLPNVDLFKIVTFYQTYGDDKSLEERLMSPAIITDRGKAFLGLQKKDGKCIFLEDNKCQIYEGRPQICRCFPYNFQIRGDHIYWGYSFKAKEYCPALLEADEENTTTLEELASQILKESEEFKKLIYVWNNLAQKNLVEPTPHILLLFITGKLQLNLEENVQD